MAVDDMAPSYLLHWRAVHRALAPALLILIVGCRDQRPRSTEMPPPADAKCGDGVLQEGEDCDGSAQTDETCISRGFDMGPLVCDTTTCTWSERQCIKRCGNGVLDLGESCDGALGVPLCDTWGANVCTATCTLDTRFCVSQPYFQNGPELTLDKGGPAVVGDVAPAGPGDLVMAVPALSRVEVFPWSMTRGFEAGSSKKLSFQRSPKTVEIVDLDGNGVTDIAVLNTDGSLDLLENQGAQYTLRNLGGACTNRFFLPNDGVARTQLTAFGCETITHVSSAGAVDTSTFRVSAITNGPDGTYWTDDQQRIHFPDGGSTDVPIAFIGLGVGDFDDDGDFDLVTATQTTVELLENTGTGYAAKLSYGAPFAQELRALDVDGDGRFDLLWVEGQTVVVRRNRSNFTFDETRLDAGTASPDRASLAVGDADGDGDLDVTLVFKTGTDSTVTRVLINRSH